jgi:hypothetical protein
MLKNSNLGCAAQLGIFAVIVIGGLMIVQALLGTPGRLIEAVQPPAPTPTTIVLPPVLEVINRQPKLQSTSYYLSTVAEARQNIGLLQQEQKVVLVACGKVTAGIDLSKITATHIRTNGANVVIALPPAEVFDASLIEGGNVPCTYVAFRTDGILLEAARDLETEARRKSVEQFRQSALDQGILAEAGENARAELRRLLTLVGYQSVEFTP